jgi:hypothetical protein
LFRRNMVCRIRNKVCRSSAVRQGLLQVGLGLPGPACRFTRPTEVYGPVSEVESEPDPIARDQSSARAPALPSCPESTQSALHLRPTGVAVLPRPATSKRCPGPSGTRRARRPEHQRAKSPGTQPVAPAITGYHNPACGTSRNTLVLIRNSGVQPDIVKYLKRPPGREKLAVPGGAQCLGGSHSPDASHRPPAGRADRNCRPVA